MLRTYWATRWYCQNCGHFDAGALNPPEYQVRMCPFCRARAILEMQCQGQTGRSLPFHTEPRERPHQKYPWLPAEASTETFDDSYRGGGRKSTGRPKKGTVRKSYGVAPTLEEILEDTVVEAMAERSTPRRCAYCPQHATRWRLQMDGLRNKPDRSSRRPVCGDH